MADENKAPSFAEFFAAKLGDRSGVEGAAGGGTPLAHVRLFQRRVSGPIVGAISPASDRGDRRPSSGRRQGAKGCACDGKRSVSGLRKAR